VDRNGDRGGGSGHEREPGGDTCEGRAEGHGDHSHALRACTPTTGPCVTESAETLDNTVSDVKARAVNAVARAAVPQRSATTHDRFEALVAIVEGQLSAVPR
jgi:hypothetical protein